MPQKTDYDRKRGMGGKENPDKRQQGNHDDRRNPNNDPDGRNALAAQQTNGCTWEPSSGQWYWYDTRTDTLVFQDGRRVPRPSHIPRTLPVSAGSQGLPTVPSSSPANRHYTTSSPTASAGSSSQNGRLSAQFVDPPLPSQQTSINSSMSAVTQSLENTTIQNRPLVPPSSSRQTAPSSKTLRGGIDQNEVNLQDPSSKVQIVYKTGPSNAITDPALLARSIMAERLLFSLDEREEETLFAGFRRRDQPKKFFTAGRVFSILWIEPPGESEITHYEHATTLEKSGQRVSSKVRRFVVILEGKTLCSAIPITTYGQAGVSKTGVSKSEHSIVYTTRNPPAPLSAEMPARGERGMRSEGIRIVADDPALTLDNMSRLDYGEINTIQHNVRVKAFGQVHPDSMNALFRHFDNVWSDGRKASRASTSKVTFPQPEPVNRGGSASAGSRQPSAASQQHNGGSKEEILQNQARMAIEKLIAKGYTAEQAMKALRTAYARRQQVNEHADDDSNDEDDDDDDSNDEDDEDN